MTMRERFLFILAALLLALAGTLALLLSLDGGGHLAVHAQGPDGHDTYFVAPGGDCGGMEPCFDNVQAAVDAADDPDDVIKVAAGTYTDVQNRPVPVGYPSPPDSGIVTQVIYISKSIAIRGGYTTTDDFAGPPDPEANPTTLDALGQGRVLFIAGAAAPGAGISPTVEGLRVTGGDAYWLGGGVEDGLWPGAGGGVYIINATATISNCWLFGNAAFYGGGLYPRYNDAKLSGNTVSSNSAYDGGGLYLYDSTATLSSNTITSNSAYNGGGLYLYDSTATLNSNTVTSNTAYYWGGGLNLRNSAATLSDNTITSNTAGKSGGGLYLEGSDAMFSGNAVSSNTANGAGGGLFLHDSDATFNGNAITANTTNDSGGGLYLWNSITTLNDNTISSNTARYGGGGLRLYNSPATTLNGNTVSSNAAYYGGGLNLGGSAATLNDNIISSNTAYTSGGGLYLEESAATLNRNIVLSNTAIYSGGGLYLQYSNATLINAVVADNRVDSAGSGLYISGSSPRLLHTTIARNSGGDGSGIYVTNNGPTHSAVALTNTILASHSVGITVTAGNTAMLKATLWHGNSTDAGGGGTVISSTNIRGDPAFVNPEAGDYHIGQGSAAIDAGVDAGVTTDIDGNSRPSGPGFDIGADELSCVYLPVVLKNHRTWDAYYEDNDQCSAAYGPLASGQIYWAYPDDANDYYYFELSAPATVNVSVTDFAPTSIWGDLLLYGPAMGDECGGLIGQWGKPGYSAMSLGPYSLGAGKYHVRVYTVNNHSTTQLYSLMVTY
jgi:parallel beta-helix repeat protein